MNLTVQQSLQMTTLALGKMKINQKQVSLMNCAGNLPLLTDIFLKCFGVKCATNKKTTKL